MAGQARLTVEQIKHALEQAAGNVSYAAKALGVSRSTMYRRINESPTLQEILTDAREELVDIAESALKSAVIDKQGWAVCFALKTQGKARGYVERQERTGKDGEPLKVDVTWRTVVEDALTDAGIDDDNG